MKKVICIMVMMSLLIMSGCGGGYNSDESCVWCNSTPTKQIKSNTEDTEAGYYCEECSTTCFLCGEKATQHYTNAFGIEVFACDECMQW